MRFGIETAKLREGTPREYVTRFVFGGLVTVVASLIAKRYGPIIGGLFLAFPGIFPGGLSMTEKHAMQRKAKQGAEGIRFSRAEASIEAAGASAGALGLAVFGFILWKGASHHPLLPTLLTAFTAWLATSLLILWLRKKL